MSLAYETMVKSLEENDTERSRMSKETNQCVREREREENTSNADNYTVINYLFVC